MLGKKALQPLDEFVLRCIEADLRKSEAVSSILGLPQRLVEVQMGRLVTSGHLVPLAPRGEEPVSFVITERGRAALAADGDIIAQERDIELAYDGLTRNFLLVEPSARWRPRDLRDNDIFEIPAFPADPPEIGPADTDAVGRVVSQVAEVADHELLSVLGLAGKREKFFILAIALVLEPVDAPGDVVVQFAIDGRPSEAHDHAFARAEGHRKLGILGSLQVGTEPAAAVIKPALLATRSDDGELEALRRATSSVRRRIAEIEERSSQSDSLDASAGQLEQLQQRLDAAEAALAQVPVRLLEVHEHPELLSEALVTASERLLIVSPWIRAGVVNGAFLRDLERLLERDVAVSIGYGIDDKKTPGDRDVEAEAKLESLAQRFPNMRFKRLGDTHAKVLVLDRRYLIVTSFNWLSFRGDARRPFRDERGTLVTVGEEIDRIYDDYTARMT